MGAHFSSLKRTLQASTPAGTWGSLAHFWVAILPSPFPHTPSSWAQGWKKEQAIPMLGISLPTLLAPTLEGIGAAGWVPDVVCTTPRGEVWKEASYRSTARTVGRMSQPQGRLCCLPGPAPACGHRTHRALPPALFHLQGEEGKGEDSWQRMKSKVTKMNAKWKKTKTKPKTAHFPE